MDYQLASHRQIPADPDSICAAAARIVTLIDLLKSEASTPLQLPGVGLKLNLESRRSDTRRKVRHVHQMCLMHTSAVLAASRISLLYYLEWYELARSAQNPLAVYGAARSMLEFHAVLRYAHRRLQKHRSSIDWERDGQEFFKILVRLRYGTSNPAKQALAASEAALPNDQIKPFHVLTCLQELSTCRKFENAMEHYEMLCDYVHPNLSSQTIAAGEAYRGPIGVGPSGRVWMTNTEGINFIYNYPAKAHADLSISTTVCQQASHAAAAHQLLLGWPETPFSDEQLNECAS